MKMRKSSTGIFLPTVLLMTTGSVLAGLGGDFSSDASGLAWLSSLLFLFFWVIPAAKSEWDVPL